MCAFSRQSGNVLFLILIAVALFATLSYVVTQSTRSPSASVSQETAKMQAGQLLGYLTGLRSAIGRMIISKCSILDLSLDDPALPAFYATATTGPSAFDGCRLFKPAGGGAAYIKPLVDLNGGTDIAFVENMGIADIGSGTSELVAIVPNLSEQVCKELNKALGWGETIPTEASRTFSNPFIKSSSLTLNPGYYVGIYTGKYAQCVKYGTLTVLNLPGYSFTNSYALYFALIEA